MLKTEINNKNGRLTITTEHGNVIRIKENAMGGIVITSVGKDITVGQHFPQSININLNKIELEIQPEIEIKQLVKNKKVVGICPMCNSNLVERDGTRGKFIGCLSYPICKYTESIYDLECAILVDEEDESYESKYGTMDDLGRGNFGDKD